MHAREIFALEMVNHRIRAVLVNMFWPSQVHTLSMRMPGNPLMLENPVDNANRITEKMVKNQ